MFLSELINIIVEAGLGAATVNEVYRTVFDSYPSIQADVYQQPMSTAQEDPWVPPELANEILSNVGVEFEPVA